jgi:hypothetical protein
VPTTRAALAVVEPSIVVKTTCGTVKAVLRTDVVELLGMTEPERLPVDSVQGTTMVVRIWTVVTGTEVWPAAVDVTVTEEAPVTITGLVPMCAAQIPWK